MKIATTIRPGAQAAHWADDSGLVLRQARKEWTCEGDGAAHPTHAPDCPGSIRGGDQYVECLWEASAYQSGSRHTIACAVAFYGVEVESLTPMITRGRQALFLDICWTLDRDRKWWTTQEIAKDLGYTWRPGSADLRPLREQLFAMHLVGTIEHQARHGGHRWRRKARVAG